MIAASSIKLFMNMSGSGDTVRSDNEGIEES